MTSLTEIAAELLTHVRNDPGSANAGRFALAAAELIREDNDTRVCMERDAARNDKHAKLFAYLESQIPILLEKVAALRKAPSVEPAPVLSPEDLRKAAEISIDQAIARRVAAGLINAAAELEELAELGHESSRGGLTMGSARRPQYSEEERREARERARELRDRAASLLANAGITSTGSPNYGLGIGVAA